MSQTTHSFHPRLRAQTPSGIDYGVQVDLAQANNGNPLPRTVRVSSPRSSRVLRASQVTSPELASRHDRQRPATGILRFPRCARRRWDRWSKVRGAWSHAREHLTHAVGHVAQTTECPLTSGGRGKALKFIDLTKKSFRISADMSIRLNSAKPRLF